MDFLNLKRLIFAISLSAASICFGQDASKTVYQIGDQARPEIVNVVHCSADGCTTAGCEGCSAACEDGCATTGCCDLCGCNSCGSGAVCDCHLGDPWTLAGALGCGECSSITFGGWLQKGYHSDSNDLFNQHPDKYNLHQAWFYVEKAAEGSPCCTDFGFRFDIMYGVDAQDTQAFGNNPGEWDYQNGFDHGSYGWAIPQLYGEIARGDWNLKLGHFFTIVGYEVVTAPDNFFYSHAITMYNSEPFMHTGGLATFTGQENVELYIGWTLGWDTGFDQLDKGSSFLGGFKLSMSESLSMTYVATGGDFGWRGKDAYSHSIVLDATLSDKLNYVVQSDLLRSSFTGEDNVGINQYLFYHVNDCLSLGTRLEWWKGDGVTQYQPHGGTLPSSGSFSYYEATIGAQIRPHANILVRPEVRFDWSPAVDYNETIFAVDAITTF